MSRSRDSSQTKAAIIEAAGELFAQRGFASVTARQVAALAGVSLSSIPYHFQTMEHLYECAVLEASKIAPEADELLRESLGAEPNCAVRLAVEWLVADFASASTSWRHRLVQREEFDPSEGFEDVVKQIYAPSLRWLCAVLSRATREPADSPQVKYAGLTMYSLTIGYLGRIQVTEMLAPEIAEALGDRDRYIELIASQAIDAVRHYREAIAGACESNKTQTTGRLAGRIEGMYP